MDTSDAVSTRRSIRDVAVDRVLAMGRERFGMDLGIVCEVSPERVSLVAKDGDLYSFGGMSLLSESPLATVARAICDGRVPMVMASTATIDFPTVQVASVGAYVAAHVRGPDGTIHGLTLFVSHFEIPELDGASAAEVSVLSRAVEKLTDPRSDDGSEGAAERIQDVIERDELPMVFQPITDLAHGWTVGYEALARFPDPSRAPDRWFADAARLDRGVQLELMAIRSALGSLDAIPTGTYLAVNVGPQTLGSEGFIDVFGTTPMDRIVIELTGRAMIDDLGPFNEMMDELHLRGARLAVDDAGGGFVSLSAMLELVPDIVKLDPILVRGIEADPVKRALAYGLVRFAGEINATTTAEGVETLQEASTLRNLGVTSGQGHHFGRPNPLV